MNTEEVRIDAMNAVNDMYNFEFEKSEKEFRWLKQQYPAHPLPYFLMGLSQWWKMLPDFDNVHNDDVFVSYMDTVLSLCDQLFEKNEKDIEATFFAAAAYGFKGRMYGERHKWTKAVYNGFKALQYILDGEELGEFSYEFKFGSGIYYYYAVWIPENYKWVKPLMFFKAEGDKKKGLDLLQFVSNNAFYTRTEAQYFLMRIFSNEENDAGKAYPMAEYLHRTFPNNSYFHRSYARIAFWKGELNKAEELAREIIACIENKKTGYASTDGRYANYFLGYIYEYYKRDKPTAKKYYEQTLYFSETGNALESGYYHAALCRLAKMAIEENNSKEAKKYYKKVLKHAEKDSKYYKEAKEKLR